MIDVIAFDADDTLWHSEILYTRAEERFEELLAPYLLEGRGKEELLATEMQNLRYYGYGIKGFALSMIETAIRVSDGHIRGSEILQIVGLAKEMADAPVQLLDNVADVIATLATSHTLMMITKGDLYDQERKVAQSGLAPHFTHIEIMSDKTTEVYAALLARHQINPRRFLMVGNSLRSDILPIVALGGRAVYIPYHTTWAHEAGTAQADGPGRFVELECIGMLPAFVEQLCHSGWTPERQERGNLVHGR